MKIPSTEKYPIHIMETVRKCLDLESNDTSLDHEIADMTPNEVFQHVTRWNGLLGGYDYTIKEWVKSIYGVDLNEISVKQERTGLN